jgi:hypothetical protein
MGLRRAIVGTRKVTKMAIWVSRFDIMGWVYIYLYCNRLQGFKVWYMGWVYIYTAIGYRIQLIDGSMGVGVCNQSVQFKSK